MGNWIEIEDSECKVCIDSGTIVDIVCLYPKNDDPQIHLKIQTTEDRYQFDYVFSERKKVESIYHNLYQLKNVEKL